MLASSAAALLRYRLRPALVSLPQTVFTCAAGSSTCGFLRGAAAQNTGETQPAVLRTAVG